MDRLKPHLGTAPVTAASPPQGPGAVETLISSSSASTGGAPLEDGIRELCGQKSATYLRRLYECSPGFSMPVLLYRSLNKELSPYLYVYYCKLLQ